MEKGVSLPQLAGTRLGTQVAVGAVGATAFEAGAQVERANIVAAVAVGACFFWIGELHVARTVGLQQHLYQRIGTPLFAEMLLIVHQQD